ncbi:MAG: site-specific integrase [Acidimicrobiia bacterium]
MTKRTTKSGDSWCHVIELGPDPSTGTRRRRTRRGFPSKKEAQSALRRELTELESGAHVDRTAMTVAEYLVGEWLPAHSQQVRPNTLESYRSAIERHIIPRIGAIRLQHLGPRDINRLYAALAEGGSEAGEPLAPKTIRNAHVVLRRALEDAVKWELIRRNPAAAASPPTASRRPPVPDPWRRHEVRTFLESVTGDELEGLWVLAATTGMRRSELLGLRWSDVDLERGRLSVVQTVVPVRGKPEVGPPKTKRSARLVHLDATATEALIGRRRRLPVHLPEDAFVFARSDGSALRHGTVTNRFQRLRERAGLRHIRLHDLRHTWATLALEAGINPKVVSEQLGHVNVSITLDTYSHVIPVLQADAVDRVAEAIYNAEDNQPSEPPRLQIVPSG